MVLLQDTANTSAWDLELPIQTVVVLMVQEDAQEVMYSLEEHHVLEAAIKLFVLHMFHRIIMIIINVGMDGGVMILNAVHGTVMDGALMIISIYKDHFVA